MIGLWACSADVRCASAAQHCTGPFCTEDTLLWEDGERNVEKYRVNPDVDLQVDFFVPDDSVPPVSLKRLPST